LGGVDLRDAEDSARVDRCAARRRLLGREQIAELLAEGAKPIARREWSPLARVRIVPSDLDEKRPRRSAPHAVPERKGRPRAGARAHRCDQRALRAAFARFHSADDEHETERLQAKADPEGEKTGERGHPIPRRRDDRRSLGRLNGPRPAGDLARRREQSSSEQIGAGQAEPEAGRDEILERKQILERGQHGASFSSRFDVGKERIGTVPAGFSVVRGCLLVCALGCALLAAGSVGAQQPVTLRIVFPEGFSTRQMVDRVAEVRRIAIRKRGVTPRLSGDTYKAALASTPAPSAFRRYLKRRNVEGFLFPSLYEFTPSTPASELIAGQIAAFERTWRAVDLRYAHGRNLNPYDVLIIASMVERETAVASERKLVSAVIYNRLKRRMPLAIDATLRYGLGIQGTRPLTKKHFRSSSPYNTRRFKGLPPTPIGNPGLPSMRAAARPAAVDYLYYLRKPNSLRHFFTADEEEFCRKAREYGYSC
jgi:uncharacterized YceG family protein